jgi:hypothetical protein
MLSKENYIKRFREIYKSKTGEEISEALALEYFEKLIVLVETLTDNNIENYGRR